MHTPLPEAVLESALAITLDHDPLTHVFDPGETDPALSADERTVLDWLHTGQVN